MYISVRESSKGRQPGIHDIFQHASGSSGDEFQLCGEILDWTQKNCGEIVFVGGKFFLWRKNYKYNVGDQRRLIINDEKSLANSFHLIQRVQFDP